jgi:hypothetical protein
MPEIQTANQLDFGPVMICKPWSQMLFIQRWGLEKSSMLVQRLSSSAYPQLIVQSRSTGQAGSRKSRQLRNGGTYTFTDMFRYSLCVLTLSMKQIISYRV